MNSATINNKLTRKSARVVGDVIGNISARRTRPFTTRSCAWRRISQCAYPLIDGQGNFGSVDGDAPAAALTKCALARLASEVLADIEKETVNFQANL